MAGLSLSHACGLCGPGLGLTPLEQHLKAGWSKVPMILQHSMLTAASEIGYLQSCVFLGGKGGLGKFHSLITVLTSDLNGRFVAPEIVSEREPVLGIMTSSHQIVGNASHEDEDHGAQQRWCHDLKWATRKKTCCFPSYRLVNWGPYNGCY